MKSPTSQDNVTLSSPGETTSRETSTEPLSISLTSWCIQQNPTVSSLAPITFVPEIQLQPLDARVQLSTANGDNRRCTPLEATTCMFASTSVTSLLPSQVSTTWSATTSGRLLFNKNSSTPTPTTRNCQASWPASARSSTTQLDSCALSQLVPHLCPIKRPYRATSSTSTST